MTDARTDSKPETAEAVVAPRKSWWHWSRLMRGRLRPALAAAVVGALLGGLVTAWQTEAGPFGGRACWGSLTKDDVAAMFSGKTDIETSEIPVTGDGFDSQGPSGHCLLQSPRGYRITARIHQLDRWSGGAGGQWADEFLSARMSPLGDDLLGMASDSRAWAAIPDGCTGRPETNGPLVIEMESRYDNRSEVETRERDQLARAVVKLVNGYMRDQGCEGTVADPVDQMPQAASFMEERSDAICGIKGLRSVHVRKDDPRPLMVTKGDGPVRTCDRNVLSGRPELRLMTVEDPRLSLLYRDVSFNGGEKIKSRGGHGVITHDLGLFQAACQTGDVTFLVRRKDGDKPALIRSLLPRYVEKEAERIGCGPIHITLPRRT